MLSILQENVFYKLLSRSDGLSQIIFWSLMIMSFLCWWIFIYKTYSIKAKIAQVKNIKNRLQTVGSLEELVHIASTLQQTFIGNLMVSSLSAVKKIVKMAQTNETLKNGDQDLLKITIDQALADIIKQENSYISVLKLAAETGPLIGLFGTVWGLITSFNRISELQTADIPTVAPGIAQALIVTLTGLFVAIPALVQYFSVKQKIQQLEIELNGLADRIEWIVSASLPKTTKGWEAFYETSSTNKTI